MFLTWMFASCCFSVEQYVDGECLVNFTRILAKYVEWSGLVQTRVGWAFHYYYLLIPSRSVKASSDMMETEGKQYGLVVSGLWPRDDRVVVHRDEVMAVCRVATH